MTYHWILTVRYNDGAQVSMSAEFTAAPGATRAAVYREIVEYARNKTNHSEDGLVLFFSLEPNKL